MDFDKTGTLSGKVEKQFYIRQFFNACIKGKVIVDMDIVIVSLVLLPITEDIHSVITN